MKSSRLPSAPLFAASAFAFLLAATLAAPTPAQAQGSPRVLQRAALAPVEGEVIVAFKPDASVMRKHALSARNDPDAVRSVLSQRAASLGSRWGRSLEAGAAVSERAQVVRAVGVDATTLARQLAADPDVLYAVPNGRKRIVTAPNDPLYLSGPNVNLARQTGGPASGQWYLRAPDGTVRSAIDIEGAWARTTGSANVVVAVLDTGVRIEHPDLTRRLLPGYDMVANSTVGNDGDGRDSSASDPGDWVTAAEAGSGTFSGCVASSSSWHGTATSSLVGAVTNSSPAIGMAGSAPGVRLLPVRVLGKCFGSDSDILAGMRWAAGIAVPGVPANPNPAKVINMSLGGSGSCSAQYQEAVDEITARGVTIVAAAGNSAGGPVNEPANCRGVVGVLALRHVGSKVGFSDLGSEISIAAPGGNCINITAGSACLYPILAATNTGAQGPITSSWTDSFDATVGTSFSSPLVAGVAALMVSRQPTLTPAALRTAMQATARPFPTSGADNGPDDPTPVSQCQAPRSGVDQLQCYCTTALCGAGMLDANAAVAAVATGPFVNATFTPAAPVAGEVVRFSLSGLQTPSNGAAQSFAWTLVDGGGAANSFSSSTNADTATISPTAGGTMRVLLTVTDAAGGSVSTDHMVIVAAPGPVAEPPPTGGTPGGGGGGGGGGASSGAWVAGVALAAAALRALRRRA